MRGDRRAAQPPVKPLLIFDGDCHFCSLWIHRWQQLTGEAVDYLPAQDPRVATQFPEIPPARLQAAVQYIDTSGLTSSGADAVFRALAHRPHWGWLAQTYDRLPLFARITEGAYRLVAGHRPMFSTLTRWGWGGHVEMPSYYLVRRVFLRALGLAYFFAFVSLWSQITGLIGHDGILPVAPYMAACKQECVEQGIGIERFHLMPTLCWFDASDTSLNLQCGAGTVISLLLVLGIVPVPALALLWALWLSLMVAGRDFMGFQWDSLLLETGFLAIFLAPLQWRLRPGREPPPSRLFIWLLRVLLFKLMFSSGCVKLLSGDPNWRNLTALTFHYQTQPLPPWTAWYASQLPLWFQKFSCAATLAIELGAPFLTFGPRRIRFLGAGLLALLQVLIWLTGNYCYFNWLTVALCVVLLDDFLLEKVRPHKPACFFRRTGQTTGRNVPGRWPFPLLAVVAAVVLAASSYTLALTLRCQPPLLRPLGWVAEELAPFRTVNTYGLFAVMTTRRNEIIVEGSNDGVHWLPYEFKFKPGDVRRRPGFVAPFQPRLDWQMWFAALGGVGDNPWFENFCARLLQGSPAVLSLLAENPFSGQPPRYIRAELYNYQFTRFADGHARVGWWRREPAGEFMPPISLKADRPSNP